MRLLLLFLWMAGSAYAGLAQSSKITGKILDIKTNQPLAGVSVKVKGAKRGTSTNAEGQFSIEAKTDDILEISSIGYTSQEVKLSGESVTVALEPSSSQLTEVVFVGSRGVPRSKIESPVPVDVIPVNNVASQTGRPDLMSQLNMSVPSFNYNKQSGGDGSDAIDFASLRGLGFDQTLVLINGKRRHQSAFVNQVGTRGRGNSGTDLNAIPEAAIDRIEILRDGASAQYGSDAIAGVINIILKKDVHKLNITTGWSGFYDKKYNTLNNVDPSQYYTGSWVDGNSYTLGVDYGLPIGTKGGFINFGGNFMAQGKTFRQVPDTNWTTNSKALSTNDWRRAAGDGSVTSGGGMMNMEIPLGNGNATLYSFGGYNYKHSNVYAWTRRWYKDNNKFKFPTDANDNLVFVPGIMRVFASSDGSINANNVYYNPQEDVYIKDYSYALGVRGDLSSGWGWDLSNNTGYNDFHYFGNKTFNASLPAPEQWTKTRFDDGGFRVFQNTTNLDLSKHFSSVAEGLTVSFGGEFRYEKYKLYAGEPDSYRDGGALYQGAAKASGSEGYPGYRPSDESNVHRTNVAGYLDLTLDVTKAWLLNGAARFENYSDFGFVNTYKLATRIKVADNFNIRGSVSTGFRAPTLQQINFSNINTNIVAGELKYVKLYPNYSAAARVVGIPPLKQETSLNASLGFTWRPVSNFTLTLDGYWIRMKNRIVITGNFDSTSVPALAAYQQGSYNDGSPLYAMNFFTNAVNTENTGVDIVADYTKKWGKKSLKLTLAGNIQGIKITKINIPAVLDVSTATRQAFFSTREEYFLKASAPRGKFSLAAEYAFNQYFSIGSHLTYFGKLVTQGFGYSSLPNATAGELGGAGISDAGNGWDPYVTTDDGKSVVPENFVFNPKITTDIYFTYKVSKHASIVWGVDNIFNVHPDLAVTKGAVQSSWGDSESGGAFDAVQMGSNGMRMFGKLLLNF